METCVTHRILIMFLLLFLFTLLIGGLLFFWVLDGGLSELEDEPYDDGGAIAEGQRSGLASRPIPTSASTPQTMFQYTIQNTIPTSVTKLQGVGYTWQGYSLYLRFNASKTDIDALIAQGFQPATWASISYRFNLPTAHDRFTPEWNPASISTKECYELSDVKNGWTHNGTHYLVIDRSTGTVYFYGIGA